MMANEREEGKSPSRDLILYALLLGIAFLGLLALYPASSVVAERISGDAMAVIKRQAVWFALGICLFFIFATLPLELLRRMALPGMGIVLFLLLLVFIPGIGHSVQSAAQKSFRRWIAIGSFTVQPSEFVKPALTLYLAAVFSRSGVGESEPDMKRLLLPLGLVGLTLLAIVLEPQFGTSVCLLGVIVTIVFLTGFPVLRLSLLFLSTLPLLGILVYLAPYRWTRFRVWLDPYAYRLEGGYQLVTAYRAFREGGLLGSEPASGFAHRYLTYGHTDFILALFGEDYGFLGILLLIVLFGGVLWRAVSLLGRIDEPFPFLLGGGALFMLTFQVLLNMAVVTGLVPTTGISLPFFSYGGSSLLASFILAGLLLNVTRSVTPHGRSE